MNNFYTISATRNIKTTNTNLRKKTDNRGFANAITHLTNQLTKLIKGRKLDLPDSFYSNYSLTYLLTKCAKCDEFALENIRTTKRFVSGQSYDSIRSFDLRLNIDDCDICLRVNGRGAQLFLGGIFSTSLHCCNGSYIHIMKELYERANGLGVAA